MYVVSIMSFGLVILLTKNKKGLVTHITHFSGATVDPLL